MKKFYSILFSVATIYSMQAAEPDNWDGVEVLPDFYAHKMSHDGTQIVGESEDGGTVYYNKATGEAYYYPDCNFGQGYVFSNNGWVVGSRLLDKENQTNEAVIMVNGEVVNPSRFANYSTSNIHSITPDGKRICGVFGSGIGPQNIPFYCDIDASGNLGELKALPTPEKDFFNERPQFCTATWISEDGKTIAGQVIDNRGLFNYPIIYTENEQGVWSYGFPSQSLFNLQGREVPQPLGDFVEEYPDAVYPEVTDFISGEQLQKWEEAYYIWSVNSFAEELNPYAHLEDFMTTDQFEAYYETELYYELCAAEYEERIEKYWEEIIEIADESVLFLRNGMAMSPDGKWLASSGEVPRTDLKEGEDFDYYYDPYLFNLQTGEHYNIGIENLDLVTNQVTRDGSVICATPAANPLPPRSYIYQHGRSKMISIYDYVNEINTTYGWWMESHLTGEVQVGPASFELVTITGLVAGNEDLSQIAGGVLYSALGGNNYFITYMMNGLPSGIKEIAADTSADGIYRVYNLQGVKIIETKNAGDIHNLPKGIYIINGRKVAL